MNTENKRLVKVASCGLLLSMLVTFLSAGLTTSAFHYFRYGGQPPEAVGWVGGFILIGLAALVAVLPSHLVILACGVSWQTQLRRHALLNGIVSLGLGCCFGVLLMSMERWSTVKDFLIISVSTCLAITCVVEVLARSKLQTQK